MSGTLANLAGFGNSRSGGNQTLAKMGNLRAPPPVRRMGLVGLGKMNAA
ncbi:MAG: hypothetical protein IPL91_05635 [Hyphomicrobium sp.]|nr:hypothetical protein [Hyphomicrobium sp.]